MRTTPVSSEIPTPRPSSTVVLIRAATDGPEVFMVKRHESASFGSAYAFPGGVLEQADRNVHNLCSGVTPAHADRLLELDNGGLDYFSAAVRELFEETSVLLGDSRLSAAELAEARDRLNDGAFDWDQFAVDSGLLIHCDQLHYFSFWITPEGLPKRYSTRFFLAEIPEGQVACHDGGELIDSCWMSAPAILQARKDKAMRVHHPTRKTLERVAEFDSAKSLCDWAKSCGERGVICDQPAFSPELFR